MSEDRRDDAFDPDDETLERFIDQPGESTVADTIPDDWDLRQIPRVVSRDTEPIDESEHDIDKFGDKPGEAVVAPSIPWDWFFRRRG